MKNISKVLFCILCINILGVAAKTNAIVKIEETGATKSEWTSYTIEDYRELKGQEINNTIPISSEAPQNNGQELMINAIFTAIKNKENQIDLTPYVSYMVKPTDATSLYFEALDKFPELFYTSSTKVAGGYYKDKDGKITKYTLYIIYTVDIHEIDSMVQAYNAKVEDIRLNYTNPLNGELENEYIVHDYILENCTYDTRVLIPDISHTAYGALVNGVAVCDGYAKAVKQLLNDCNIESGIVTNNAEDHAWNYVKIQGQYYHLDATWNDPVPETNINIYKYFNISDTDLSKVSNHDIPEFVYPVAISNSFDFLRNNYIDNGYYPKKVGDKLYYTKYDSGDLRSMNLDGTDDTLVSSGLNFIDFEGYKSKIYVNEHIEDPLTSEFVNSIISYNLISKEIKTEYKTEKYIVDIYKKNSQLFIKTEDGNIDNISIAMKEDVSEDGIIDIEDVAKVAVAYNKAKDTIGYLIILDINNDGIVNIDDINKILLKI